MSNAELMAVNREPDATWAIPSEDEWYKAAYHKNDGVTGNYFDYPTSNDAVPSNDLDQIRIRATTPTFYQSGWDYTIGSPYWRTEVGGVRELRQPVRYVRPGCQRVGVERGEWCTRVVSTRTADCGAGRSSNPGYYLRAAYRFD